MRLPTASIGLKKKDFNRSLLRTYIMKSKILCALFIFSILLMNAYAQETDWKLEKEKEGIAVYTRNFEEVKIKEFKATTDINAEMEILVAMVLDVEEYSKWMENVKSAEVIKKISEDELYIYSVVDVPWPFDDRDVVTIDKVSRDASSGVVTISIQGVEGMVPEKEGVIRMPESGGFWKFTPQKNGRIAIVYQYLADPGGGIPDWLVNMFLVDGPYKTLENMKRIAEKI
jgi:hypothetical protein